MRHIDFFDRQAKPQAKPKVRSPFWGIVWIGLPLTTVVLLATQSGWRDRAEQRIRDAFNPLDAPYQYPFSTRDRTPPTAGITQEIGFYQEQLRQNPKSALDHAALASGYLRMARTTGQNNWYLLAEESARQSLALLPYGNMEAIAVLARIAEAQHDFEGALKLTEQMPGEREAIALQTTANLALGNLEEASKAADTLVDLTLSTNAFTLQALVKTAQGQDEAALQSFQYALEVEERGELSVSARVRTLLGRYHYKRGQLGLAGELYREALGIVPQYPLALLNLAQLDIRQGRYRSAEQHYRRLAALSQGSSTVYDPLILRGRARIQVLQGDRPAAEVLWADAETVLRQSLSGTDPSSFGHRRDLARLLLERGQSPDIPEAVALMTAEVQLRRDADTLSTYAWALSEAGQWQQAKQTIDEAIAQGVRDPDLFHRASLIAQGLGDSKQAQAYLQQAQAIDPQFDTQAQQAAGLGTGLGS